MILTLELSCTPKNTLVMCPMISAGMKSVSQAYSVIYAIAAVDFVV